MKRYADLYGNIKRLGIKNPSDNKMDDSTVSSDGVVKLANSTMNAIEQATTGIEKITTGVDAVIRDSVYSSINFGEY